MTSWRRGTTAAGLGACVVAAALGFVGSYAVGQAAGQEAQGADVELIEQGRALYQVGCSTCHGEDAAGTGEGDNAVPSLIGVGAAAADFQLRTGRMPLAVIGQQAVRKPPAYTDAEIEALVAYVASLAPGPAIPVVDVASADTVAGGELFRANCAACHNAAGVGGALSYGHHAPSLLQATPTEVVEAMRTGPGQMPVFGPDSFTDEEATDIAAYVTGELQQPDNRGGLALGSTGPVPEGFVAWTVGIVVIGAALRWIVRGGAVPEPDPAVESAVDRAAGAPSARPPSGPTTHVPVIAFVISILAAVLGLAVVYSLGGQPQWEGVLLCLSLGGIGVGVISWAHRFLPPGPDEEPREQVASSEEALAALDVDLIAGEEEFGRRPLLVRLLAGAAAALGLAALFPIRSLGPGPGAGLKTSPFAAGDHLITEQGTRVRPEDIAVDGFVTVFPEGNLEDANAPTLLIHTRPGQNVPRPGREDWAVDDLVAYSKICTHAGCPVGLYQAASGLLLCPCHQSTFDVGDGSRPVFGPATRSLPQLPLTLDDDGYLIASGEFSSPVGPGFWNQLR